MKKFKFYVLSLITLVMLAISCVSIDDNYGVEKSNTFVNNKGEYAILFSKQVPTTKATYNSLSGTGYDEFNLFVWNSNNDTIMNPYLVKADDVDSYRYDNVGTQELKYFSNTANFYDFIGVIPTDHNTTLANGIVTIDTLKSFVVDDNRVTGTLTADSPEEFLWSYKNVVKADYGSLVELPFNHGNSVIYLGFSSDRDDTVLIDYVPGTPEIPAVNDTTDTWINLKRSSGNVDGSATRTRVKTGDTWGGLCR